VLTDNDLNIIALLRIVSEGQEQEELRVGLKYNLGNKQNSTGIPRLTLDRVKEGLHRAADIARNEIAVAGKKLDRRPENALRKALAKFLNEFPLMLIDHALLVREFDTTATIEAIIESDVLLDRLMEVLGEAQRTVDDIMQAKTSKGYIIAKMLKDTPTTSETDAAEGKCRLLYDDFQPFRRIIVDGAADIELLEFDTFNQTVDEYFTSIETQKLESRLSEREDHARKRLENARLDHQRRVGGLQQVQELNIRKAQAIEANLERVGEVTAAINGLIAQGMDWVEIARLVTMEQAGQNPVADMIQLPLKLYENTATILLSEADFQDGDDYEGNETGSDASDSEDERDKNSNIKNVVKATKPTDRRLAVDVNLALSPWSNARQYYDEKKIAAIKEQKTLLSSEMALRSTEKKISADLKKNLKQEKDVLRPVRRQLWFEKFYYFISSEGYLVLCGRDSQQNEILYKKYLTKGDIYVHADIPGAALVIVKNKLKMTDSPPPSTLSQAGAFCVITSNAWNSKATMASWWVHPEQVSKTATTGDFLPAGVFEIRGQKNYLPPAQLLLGFGVMFQISERSLANHVKHRFKDSEDKTNTASPPKLNTVLHVGLGRGQDGSDQSDEELDQSSDSNHVLKHDVYENRADSSEDYEQAEQDGRSFYQQNSLQASHILCHPSQATLIRNDHSNEQLCQEPSQSNECYSSEESGATKPDWPLSTTQPSPSAIIPTPTSTSALPSSSRKLPQGPQVRGKHGKRSKQKTKYAHQDEGDRALALRLLGSTASKEKFMFETRAKAAREEQLAVQKERRQEQHSRAQQTGKESEEARRQKIEHGAELLDEDELADLSLLENYVGTTLPGDDILDCLVVCGPWDALGSRLRWRVKIQPGAVKKMKAVQEILGSWSHTIREKENQSKVGVDEQGYEELKVMKREAELVKNLRDVEIMGCVPVGKCRVMVNAGGNTKPWDTGANGKRGGRGSKRK
jgi:predicted ribosome quality control (RQC) complex YloA/Tae2 family protein